MSRSAAARTEHDHASPASNPKRPHGRVIARRVSGPLRQPRTRVDTGSDAALAPQPRIHGRPPPRLAAGGAAIALRVAEAALEVSGSRTMDRLVRSRAWIVIVGIGLIGIVAMQVSLLKLNAGIGRAVDTVATLERSNATLKGEVSRLSSGDRIQALAGQRGFIMPEPADVTYLRAGSLRSTGARAARRMRAPDRSIAGPAGAVLPPTVAPAPTPQAQANAPAATAPATPPSGQVASPATPATPAPTAATAAPVAPPATPASGAAPAPTGGATPAPAAPVPPTNASGGVTPP